MYTRFINNTERFPIMTFVIYNKQTTKLAYRAGRGISKKTWNTESSAKSFLTRCEKGLSRIPIVLPRDLLILWIPQVPVIRGSRRAV